jgi:hypothetical protein
MAARLLTLGNIYTVDDITDFGFRIINDSGKDWWYYRWRFEAYKEPIAMKFPKECGTTATKTQVGGDHYKEMKIQPIDFIVENEIPFREANAIKYIVRHAKKNGAQDIRKAIHYLQMILEKQYPGQ